MSKNMNNKFKCVVCGTFVTAIITIEILPLICNHCKHIHFPEHLPEENFHNNIISNNINAVRVSGLSSTVTASLDVMDFD